MNNHSLLIRVLTTDGEVVLTDSDFSEDARWDWFEENVRQAEAGEIVQLIDLENDNVIAEKLI